MNQENRNNKPRNSRPPKRNSGGPRTSWNRQGGNRSGGNRSGGPRFRGKNRFGGDRRNNFNREPKEMHKVVCAECKKYCEVPFKPTGIKPVYCKDCFSKHKKF